MKANDIHIKGTHGDISPLTSESKYPVVRKRFIESVSSVDKDGMNLQQNLHPDFVTYLPGIEYFVLGNGDIQAVVQHSLDKTGPSSQSLFGLTLMDPERFSRKWSTFLFHPENGFSRTSAKLSLDGKTYPLVRLSHRDFGWKHVKNVPILSVGWVVHGFEVNEEFFVPNEGGLIFRRIQVRNRNKKKIDTGISLELVPNFALFDEIYSDQKTRVVKAHGFRDLTLSCLEKDVITSGRYNISVALGRLRPGETRSARFVYSIKEEDKCMSDRSERKIWEKTVDYWASKNYVQTGNDVLDHMYDVSKIGFRALTARSGKYDGALWMYNMEWVRDEAMIVLGMLQTGMFREAGIMIERILTKLVDARGRTMESGRWFPFDYTELDQNGQLLYTIWAYACWTGDYRFLKENWKKIELVAEFPLREAFWDKNSKLLHNKREFWERSDSHGVEDGFELVYQFWVVLGLEKAVELAERLGYKESSARWQTAASEIKNATLCNGRFRLIEDGHLVKRRTRDGRWQKQMIPLDRTSMPRGSPLATIEKPSCEPDTCEVMPIAYGMIDPNGELSHNTLGWVEHLWNQHWDSGGYSRYNVFSEPDPPAPWPLASLFMARAHVEAGDYRRVWRSINWVHRLKGGSSGAWFERYGQSITPPSPPVGIVGWASSEITSLIVQHIIGLRPGLDRFTVRPKLLDGLSQIRGRFKVRGSHIDLLLSRSEDQRFGAVNGKRIRLEANSLILPYPSDGRHLKIELHV